MLRLIGPTAVPLMLGGMAAGASPGAWIVAATWALGFNGELGAPASGAIRRLPSGRARLRISFAAPSADGGRARR